MNEVWKQVIFEALQGVIGIAITILLAFIRKKYSQYVNTETKQKIVTDVVYYIEQVFKTLHGAEKLEKAKNTIVSLLNSKGINFTEEELNVLIESTVNQLNLAQGNLGNTLPAEIEETTEAEIVDEDFSLEEHPIIDGAKG